MAGANCRNARLAMIKRGRETFKLPICKSLHFWQECFYHGGHGEHGENKSSLWAEHSAAAGSYALLVRFDLAGFVPEELQNVADIFGSGEQAIRRVSDALRMRVTGSHRLK